MIALNDKQRSLLSTVVCYVEEVLVDERQGVPQSKYVVEIPDGASYWDDDKEEFVVAPSEVCGFWIMKFSYDLRHTSQQKAFAEFDDWVKCEKRDVIVQQWVESD